jgi:hypothetical protein
MKLLEGENGNGGEQGGSHKTADPGAMLGACTRLPQ